jgi:hypothetical protein
MAEKWYDNAEVKKMKKQFVVVAFVLVILFSFARAESDLSGPADPAVDARLRASFFQNTRPSISNLLAETEIQIGQRVVFIASPDSDTVAARCIYDTARHEPRIFLRKDWQDIEVAHELIHVRMDLIEGFAMLAWRRDVERAEAISAAFGRLQTYVKDEVVHARLIKMGLKIDGEVIRPSLFDSVYRNAALYLDEGRDRPNDGMAHLDKLGYGPLCRVCFLVQAELILKNYREQFPAGRVELAERFIRAFRKHRKEESAKADVVLELFRKNDVQSPSGQDEILRAWAKMEGLDKFVGVSSYRKDQESRYTLPFPE